MALLLGKGWRKLITVMVKVGECVMYLDREVVAEKKKGFLGS